MQSLSIHGRSWGNLHKEGSEMDRICSAHRSNNDTVLFVQHHIAPVKCKMPLYNTYLTDLYLNYGPRSDLHVAIANNALEGIVLDGTKMNVSSIVNVCCDVFKPARVCLESAKWKKQR